MKIAFIVPYVPNQVRTRSYNLITYLSRLGHEVDVFTVGSGKIDLADAEALKARCRAVYYYVQPVWRSLSTPPSPSLPASRCKRFTAVSQSSSIDWGTFLAGIKIPLNTMLFMSSI